MIIWHVWRIRQYNRIFDKIGTPRVKIRVRTNRAIVSDRSLRLAETQLRLLISPNRKLNSRLLDAFRWRSSASRPHDYCTRSVSTRCSQKYAGCSVSFGKFLCCQVSSCLPSYSPAQSTSHMFTILWNLSSLTRHCTGREFWD